MINKIEKLRNKFNISYEEAREALQVTEGNMLDAVVYLENKGIIEKPNEGIYYTNKYKSNSNDNKESLKKENVKEKHKPKGFFELICQFIDRCNNIFFKINKNNRTIIKLPLTVIILLVTFTFGTIVTLIIVGLFFDIEFEVEGENMDINKINTFLKNISNSVKKIKKDLKKGD